MRNARLDRSGLRGAAAIAAFAAALCLPAAEARDEPPRAGAFLVVDRGIALLGPDGVEVARLGKDYTGDGAISPDGQLVAYYRPGEARGGAPAKGELVVARRDRPDAQTILDLAFGGAGSSLRALWSPDSTRLLICEEGSPDGRRRESAHSVYHLAEGRATPVRVPEGVWPTDWSADGRRVLTSPPTRAGVHRLAWVALDGDATPEFVGPDDGVPRVGGKVSPDGRRILCKAITREPSGRERERLCVLDVASGKQVLLDEPGETHGYCWSRRGRVAYTWQRTPLAADRVAGAERETLLITCDADGGNRKTVTTRRHRVGEAALRDDGVTLFFEVLSWSE